MSYIRDIDNILFATKCLIFHFLIGMSDISMEYTGVAYLCYLCLCLHYILCLFLVRKDLCPIVKHNAKHIFVVYLYVNEK
jgi:hypothetical protein